MADPETPRDALKRLYTLTGANQPTTPEGKHERMLEVYRILNRLDRHFQRMEALFRMVDRVTQTASTAMQTFGKALQTLDDEGTLRPPSEASFLYNTEGPTRSQQEAMLRQSSKLLATMKAVSQQVHDNTDRSQPSGLLHSTPEVDAAVGAASICEAVDDEIRQRLRALHEKNTDKG